MNKKLILIILLSLLAVVSLTGCGYVDPAITHAENPGFWMGIWHGLIAPYSLIVRLFWDVGFYAVPNGGWWYDFGFFLGITGAIPCGWLAAIIALFF